MEQTKTTKQRKKRGFFLWALYGLLGLLVVLAVYLMVMKITNRIPTVFGYSVLQIISPSMEDAIPTGEYILIQKTDPNQVKPEDIITFYSQDEAIYMQPNTHRVVAVDKNADGPVFTTKGDNNSVADNTKVSADNLIGKYQRSLPALTKVGGVFQNKAVFLLLVLIPAAVFLITELVNVARVSRSVKKENEAQAIIDAEKARLRAQGEETAHDEAETKTK